MTMDKFDGWPTCTLHDLDAPFMSASSYEWVATTLCAAEKLRASPRRGCGRDHYSL